MVTNINVNVVHVRVCHGAAAAVVRNKPVDHLLFSAGNAKVDGLSRCMLGAPARRRNAGSGTARRDDFNPAKFILNSAEEATGFGGKARPRCPALGIGGAAERAPMRGFAVPVIRFGLGCEWCKKCDERGDECKFANLHCGQPHVYWSDDPRQAAVDGLQGERQFDGWIEWEDRKRQPFPEPSQLTLDEARRGPKSAFVQRSARNWGHPAEMWRRGRTQTLGRRYSLFAERGTLQKFRLCEIVNWRRMVVHCAKKLMLREGHWRQA